MKKSTDKISISMRTVESDLKTLFQAEDCFSPDTGQDEPAPTINLEQAVQLFDKLRAADSTTTRSSRETNWSHPSVLTLNDPDPISAIIMRARGMVLNAMERGWGGPPYNPFALAEMLGIKLLPTENVLDARTHSDSSGPFTIEFNPQRPAARTRYSIAHELGHTLFPDCASATRNRATHQEMKDDDWQLESLCNIAAAEILIPFGTLQEELSIRPSIGLVLELRRKYLVSCEAIVNRLIKLSAYPCVAFLARLDSVKSRYFVEYRIASPALRDEFAIHRGYVLPHSSKASECIAIGTRGHEDARWISGGRSWFVEYLGISPNTGESSPRVLGLAFPPLDDTFRVAVEAEPGIFLHELLEKVRGVAEPDEVYLLIAGSSIYVDLSAAAIAEPDRVRVFANAETAKAYDLACHGLQSGAAVCGNVGVLSTKTPDTDSEAFRPVNRIWRWQTGASIS